MVVKSFLMEHPVENNLIIGILDRISENAATYGDRPPVLATVSRNNEIVLISTRTPPWNSILSYTENLDAVDFFAEELMKKDPNTPGVLGPKPAVKRFIDKWVELKGVKLEIGMNERIYKLSNVNPETLGDHEFIVAKRKHQTLIKKWGYAFITEALPETPLDQIESSLKRAVAHIKEGKIFLLLDNGKPVSMARSVPTAFCGRLNYVYTPPELRKKGYATECVAKLSKKLLEDYEYCVLFTDLGNPTSNSIYQKIGYKPVMDVDLYKFD
ncbi:MAG: GNAT family N-acetyltransferase [Promethearchaeota archaeon]